MDLLLSGSVKEDRRAELGVSLGIDMSKLDVCFGGFAPTVVGDLITSCERAAESEQRLAQRKAALIKAEQLEQARESELRTWTDDAGTVWEHVLLDGAGIRIKRCQTQARVLDIPAEIAGHPVLEIAPDACSNLASVEEVIVPDSVVAIGDCAFRSCVNLTRAVLPSLVARFSADWFRYCNKLASLTLPGALEVLTPRIFDHGALKELVIGEGTRDIQPGMFMRSQLETISVHDANPYLSTDGHALYSKDGRMMAALATPVSTYEVRDECSVLGKKAFSSFACVEEVTLPNGLEVIGEFAFAGTSVTEFDAPASLSAILEKAFYGCRDLKAVTLNEGLEVIGPSAFQDTGLTALSLPATVRDVGAHVVDGTAVRLSGADASFSISAQNDVLMFDGCGGLYRKTPDGLVFLRLMDQDARTYEVLEGTVEVSKQAFDCARMIERVQLPDGLQKIGGAAFRGCNRLQHVNMPNSVTWIGGDAFLDTCTEEMTLPAGLQHLGTRALITWGAHHGSVVPSLSTLTVQSGCVGFRMCNGMLLMRKNSGAERVVVYVGPDEVVRIPDTVDEISPYAFNGVTTVKELWLSDRITTVGVRGLAVDAPLRRIHIDMVQPYEGHGAFDIYPPQTDRSEQQIFLALSVPTFVNVEALFEHYDNAIINGSSFDALSENGLDAYEQAVRLIERLEDPVYMSAVGQDMARRVLRMGLCDIALEMARHDDRDSLRRLADLGVLTGQNIDDVIGFAQRVQDASITGFLLELKRERFGKRMFDFSL